jgi:peptidoglycan hydrolase-like protein with peptidoglycan-binding domain
MSTPVIPDTITVHLGAPNDTSAANVQVPFIDYIKNVASSEIYPTWPEEALKANILAQISYALNRVYTEWYRSRGYDFDITSVTQYDQKFIYGREIFDNISQLVDEIFNDYVIRQGTVQPLFTQYCDGDRVQCDGLSQWGTVDLANQGLNAYEILQSYYGNDIGIVRDAPTGPNLPSYPGVPLRLGSAGEEVRTIQKQLNRIARNYPALAPTQEVTGIYTAGTEAMVRRFQEIFGLTVDGIVGKATWYKIKAIYNAVKGLGELVSEGLKLEEVERVFSKVLRLGDTGDAVRIIQYFLAIIGFFDERVPAVTINGTFDEATEAAVRAFQQLAGIAVDGIVGRDTWNALNEAAARIRASLPGPYQDATDAIYPGQFQSPGQSGPEVAALQRLLIRANENGAGLPAVQETGTFDEATEAAVRVLQKQAGLPENGIAGPLTWAAAAQLAGA